MSAAGLGALRTTKTILPKYNAIVKHVSHKYHATPFSLLQARENLMLCGVWYRNSRRKSNNTREMEYNRSKNIMRNPRDADRG